MVKRLISLVLVSAACVAAAAQITLEECRTLAAGNYPLIHRYRLLEGMHKIDLSDINKSWLPQIGVYGQATVQNVVPALPEMLSEMLQEKGFEYPGLSKAQYKAGIDLSQTVWDGGVSKSRLGVERALDEERRSSLEVQMYAINERVDNLYFSILLIEEQICQTELTQRLLESNLAKLRSMKKNGTAMQSDIDMLEAQYLTVGQQLIQAKSGAASYRRLLGIYTGRDLSDCPLVKPEAAMPESTVSQRPELSYYDTKLKSNEMQLSNIKASLMPKIGLFAQAYYGYPGFDYFKSMRTRDLSFNVLAGVKVSWNIGSFYTRGNSERRLRLASEEVRNEREVFLFNTDLQAQSQTAAISEFEELMREDARIVELRAAVRRAAESQLENGVIDATALLTKITDEKLARLNASYHEIQFLQNIYKLKNTLNR